ncbi:MAG TPA: cyclic nucleotide-binding domain-containing protein [Solimonas sp.]|nr:cyclic nucleotide-binding domain-containing protein [Solimonas sp.]
MALKGAEAYWGVLNNSAVFRGLEPRALDLLVHTGLMLDAATGSLVLYENERSSPGLYLLVEGEVEVFLAQDDGDVHLSRLQPGECFGEYSLIDGKATSASLRALTPSRLFFLPSGLFQRMVENDLRSANTIYRNLLVQVIGRLRERAVKPELAPDAEAC